MIRSLAYRIILSEGWARALIAIGAGALGALAMPPFGFWPALAASLAAAVWLIDGAGTGRRHRGIATLARAATAGWLWGFGYFVAGLWWLGSAFLVEADVFAWLLPVGVLGLPAVLAVFPAFGFALARALWSPGWPRLFAFAFGLAVSEWLRGHLFTGFPWNAPGLALGQDAWLMQSASLVGMAGLTAIAALVLATPAALGTGEGAGERYGPFAAGALALALMAAFGASRLPAGPVPSVADVRLRIMQPNLSQDAKFRPANGPDILRRYLALSDRSASPDRTGLADVTHLVWPESAFPFLLHREPNALAAIAGALGKGGLGTGALGTGGLGTGGLGTGTVLITGAARQDEGLPGEEAGRFYNAIQAVGPDGAITATYDKVHLVPFGEYVPAALDTALRRIGIREFVKIPGGFTPGDRRAALRVAGLPPAAPTICYEAIFPDEVAVQGQRPAWILNVTNDGWFGDTPGPRQHFAQARLRAVEQGLPLVRAANTGISAVVDPYGRVLASLPVGREGILDSGLPSALPEPLAASWAHAIFSGLCTMLALVAIVGPRNRWPRRSAQRSGGNA